MFKKFRNDSLCFVGNRLNGGRAEVERPVRRFFAIIQVRNDGLFTKMVVVKVLRNGQILNMFCS